VAGDEDDGDVVAAGLQHVLQVEAARPRHAHVEHEAAGLAEIALLEKLLRRRERPDVMTRDPEQTLQAPTDRRIVVDDDHRAHHGAHGATAPLTGSAM
jgi:hypothetical protein